jgi:hypothetical protein
MNIIFVPEHRLQNFDKILRIVCIFCLFVQNYKKLSYVRLDIKKVCLKLLKVLHTLL